MADDAAADGVKGVVDVGSPFVSDSQSAELVMTPSVSFDLLP